MNKLVLLTCTAAALAVPAAPAAASEAPSLPPTDPVHIEGGNSGCQPDYPCTPEPISVEVDKTYPSRVIVWVKSLPLAVGESRRIGFGGLPAPAARPSRRADSNR